MLTFISTFPAPSNPPAERRSHLSHSDFPRLFPLPYQSVEGMLQLPIFGSIRLRTNRSIRRLTSTRGCGGERLISCKYCVVRGPIMKKRNGRQRVDEHSGCRARVSAIRKLCVWCSNTPAPPKVFPGLELGVCLHLIVVMRSCSLAAIPIVFLWNFYRLQGMTPGANRRRHVPLLLLECAWGTHEPRVNNILKQPR